MEKREENDLAAETTDLKTNKLLLFFEKWIFQRINFKKNMCDENSGWKNKKKLTLKAFQQLECIKTENELKLKS